MISLVIAFHCWVAIENSASVDVARIIIGWDPHVLRLTVLHTSSQMICAKVEALDLGKSFFVSVVYGSNAFLEGAPLGSYEKA